MSDAGRSLRGDRAKCYQARDLYLACLDFHLDAGKSEPESDRLCRKERKAFESDCPSSWVGHFIRKHNFERYKSQLADQGVNIIDRQNIEEGMSYMRACLAAPLLRAASSRTISVPSARTLFSLPPSTSTPSSLPHRRFLAYSQLISASTRTVSKAAVAQSNPPKKRGRPKKAEVNESNSEGSSTESAYSAPSEPPSTPTPLPSDTKKRRAKIAVEAGSVPGEVAKSSTTQGERLQGYAKIIQEANSTSYDQRLTDQSFAFIADPDSTELLFKKTLTNLMDNLETGGVNAFLDAFIRKQEGSMVLNMHYLMATCSYHCMTLCMDERVNMDAVEELLVRTEAPPDEIMHWAQYMLACARGEFDVIRDTGKLPVVRRSDAATAAAFVLLHSGDIDGFEALALYSETLSSNSILGGSSRKIEGLPVPTVALHAALADAMKRYPSQRLRLLDWYLRHAAANHILSIDKQMMWAGLVEPVLRLSGAEIAPFDYATRAGELTKKTQIVSKQFVQSLARSFEAWIKQFLVKNNMEERLKSFTMFQRMIHKCRQTNEGITMFVGGKQKIQKINKRPCIVLDWLNLMGGGHWKFGYNLAERLQKDYHLVAIYRQAFHGPGSHVLKSPPKGASYFYVPALEKRMAAKVDEIDDYFVLLTSLELNGAHIITNDEFTRPIEQFQQSLFVDGKQSAENAAILKQFKIYAEEYCVKWTTTENEPVVDHTRRPQLVSPHLRGTDPLDAGRHFKGPREFVLTVADLPEMKSNSLIYQTYEYVSVKYSL